MKLTDLFTPAAIAASYTEDPSNAIPYLGVGLFPARKKAGLDLSWIKGRRGIAVSLKPSNFDSKATYRDRIGISKTETEMPFFREAYRIDERQRQDILRAQDTNDPFAQAAIDFIYDDVGELVRGADVVPERMRMQLLAPADGDAGISIVANNVDYTYHYDPDEEWKATNYRPITTAADKWNVPATAKPLTDLREAQDAIEDLTGTRPDTAIMSRKTFSYLLASDEVRSAILAQNLTANIFMTDEIARQVVASLLGISIIVYNKKFRDENKAVHQFYPDDYVTLFSSGAPLGETWYGTTPEEADLLGDSNAQVSIVNTGVAVTRIITPHPVSIDIIASEIVLPSYEGMDNVCVLKVA